MTHEELMTGLQELHRRYPQKHLLAAIQALCDGNTLPIYQAVLREREAAIAERDALAALLPGVYYMDPPDGGDVSIVEQFKRMAADAARWRWWCSNRRDGLTQAKWNLLADRNMSIQAMLDNAGGDKT